MNHIELYAELLTNIRTVTLVASLKTESNQETKAVLSADGQTITVSHEGSEANIRLPTRMRGGGTAALTLPPRPSKDLTLRLQLEEREPGFLGFEGGEENLIPWPASELADARGVGCRGCGTEVVRWARAGEWKDLPGENWAEMMEFWHCHKPKEEGSENEDAASKKGYSAANQLRASSGTGFVGLSYLILAEDDCCNVEITKDKSLNNESPTLQCSTCAHTLGIADPSTEGWKYYKWSLQIQKEDESKESCPVPKWISTQLLAAVENSGVRRFVVEPTGPQPDKTSSEALLLWLFTDSLLFSSSHNFHLRSDPTRAMKIFWKRIGNPQELLEKQHFSHEQLHFPPAVFEILGKTLDESAMLLPEGARTFQEWRVGLLERFSWGDVKGSDARILPKPKAGKGDGDDAGRGEIEGIEGGEALLQ